MAGVPDLESLSRRLGHQLPILDARRAGADLYGSPRFNVFDLFRPDENKISLLISDLLDPAGMHGHGSLFVNGLLTAIGVPPVGLNDAVKVRREMATPANRRIDILIETRTAIVGIENKPWASQQPRQLSDYLTALRRWAGGKQHALVFLSHQDAQTARDDVMAVTFADTGVGPSLQSILAMALPRVRSDRVRTHLHEFISYIDTRFGESLMVDDSNEPYVEAVKAEFASTSNRRAVAAVLLSSDKLHEAILNEVGEYLLARLKDIHPDFELVETDGIYDLLYARYQPWQVRRASWPSNLSLCIEASKSYWTGVTYGVRAPDPRDKAVKLEGSGCPARPQVENALRSFNGGSRTSGWPWWAYCTMEEWGTESAAQMVLHSPTGRVGDHPDIAELAERLRAFAIAIDIGLQED